MRFIYQERISSLRSHISKASFEITSLRSDIYKICWFWK